MAQRGSGSLGSATRDETSWICVASQGTPFTQGNVDESAAFTFATKTKEEIASSYTAICVDMLAVEKTEE